MITSFFEVPPTHRRPVIVFVHGFGSSGACWNPLVSLLRRDPNTRDAFDLEMFEYPTSWFSVNPLRRIPEVQEIASSLRAFLDSPRLHERERTLVGHSQGGLVILSYLMELLTAGQGLDLATLRQVILIATPTAGSPVFSALRRILALMTANPQERTLRLLNPEIARIRSFIQERVVHAQNRSDHAWPVPVHSFFGLRDGIVPEASARGPFYNVTALDGDHFTMIQPGDLKDGRYSEFVEALLEPWGHVNVYEVDCEEMTLAIRPAIETTEFEVGHGGVKRVVRTDNLAHMTRRVTLSRRNRCTLPMTIRYRTTNHGFVRPLMSHHNEASPAQIAAYEDAGTEVQFTFTPKPGTTYSLVLDVYKGFDAGHRDIHFHLGRRCHFKRIVYRMDLSAYRSAGYRVSGEPTLHFHATEPENHDVCSRRGFGQVVARREAGSPGIWEWELRGIQEGVLDLTWDVAR